MRRSHLHALLASLSLVSVVLIQHAEGQHRVNEGAKVTASDAAAGDEFGISVSICGDVVVVGAHEDDRPGSRTRAQRTCTASTGARGSRSRS